MPCVCAQCCLFISSTITTTAAAPAAAAAAAVVPDDMIVAQLLGMDIPINAAQRAAIAVSNASADAALDWVRLVSG
jgi:uncharacterized UBP type Zn finger protein